MLTPFNQPDSETNNEFFNYLYDTYGGALYKVIIDFTTTTEEAETVFTESFRQIFIKHSPEQGIGNIRYVQLLQVVIQTLSQLYKTPVNKAELINYFQNNILKHDSVKAA